MSKSVMISIRPKWCEKIVNGEKTIEVRKTRPKLNTPFRVYIYCTLPKYPHEDYIRQREPAPQAPAPKLVLCAGGLTMAKYIERDARRGANRRCMFLSTNRSTSPTRS